MGDPVKREPVFIVGVPRSGTTLLAAMLDAHSKMSCGPETDFFRQLAQIDYRELIDAENWPDKAVAFMASIEHTSSLSSEKKFLLNKYQLERPSLTHYLAEKPPEIRHILEAVTEQYMQRMGKQRWLEKTPDHLEYIQSIRTFFPQSPIIRIIRDPRDVALSLTKVPWGAQSVIEALFFLRRLDDASAPFFVTDENAYTLHYEDLVSDSEGTLRTLCAFLGEAFEMGMLDTSKSGRRINSRNAPWKEKVSKPVDKSRVEVWRHELTAVENRLVEAVFGDRIAAYEYVVEGAFTVLGEAFPDERPLIKYATQLEPIAAQGVRFWAEHEGEQPGATVYLGDPSEESWMGTGRWNHLRRTWQLTWRIIRAVAGGKRVYWIPNPEVAKWSGVSAAWLKLLLRAGMKDEG